MEIVTVDQLNEDLKLVAEGVAEVTGEKMRFVLRLTQTKTVIAYTSTWVHAEAYRIGLEGINRSFEADTSVEPLPVVKRSFLANARHWFHSQFMP